MELLFQLVFAKQTELRTNHQTLKRSQSFQRRRGHENPFSVCWEGTYEQVVKKIIDGLSERTGNVVQRHMLLANFPQGSKSFEKWSQEESNAAKLISYDNYDWQQAAIDDIILQTSNAALRERSLYRKMSLLLISFLRRALLRNNRKRVQHFLNKQLVSNQLKLRWRKDFEDCSLKINC